MISAIDMIFNGTGDRLQLRRDDRLALGPRLRRHELRRDQGDGRGRPLRRHRQPLGDRRQQPRGEPQHDDRRQRVVLLRQPAQGNVQDHRVAAGRLHDDQERGRDDQRRDHRHPRDADDRRDRLRAPLAREHRHQLQLRRARHHQRQPPLRRHRVDLLLERLQRPGPDQEPERRLDLDGPEQLARLDPPQPLRLGGRLLQHRRQDQRPGRRRGSRRSTATTTRGPRSSRPPCRSTPRRAAWPAGTTRPATASTSRPPGPDRGPTTSAPTAPRSGSPTTPR